MTSTMKAMLSMVSALLFLSTPGRGGRLLVLHPMFAPSHILALRTLTAHMTDRGHSVTVVSVASNLPSGHRDNTTQIRLPMDNPDGTLPLMTRGENARVILPTDAWENGMKFNFLPLDGLLTIAAFCRSLLSNTVLIDRLRDQQFDVVLVDLIYNECSLALAHHLDVPAVGYWAFTFAGYEPMYTTGYNPPSTVPYVFSQIGGDLGFRDRLWNYFLHLYQLALTELLFLVVRYQVSYYLPDTPHPATLLANLSGALINSHPALDYPRKLPPTFLEVGGFHINPPKPLPQHLEQFLSSAGSAGAILFSLGCTFNTDMMPPAVVRGFLSAFARLPNKVLVRGTGQLPPLPPNVMVVDWLPQADVLAHPSTVLFVTHCGMHGVMESIHHAVPMVGLPIFGDQQDVLLRLQEKGVIVGVGKDLDDGGEALLAAIREVLSNSTYRNKVSYLSRVMRHHNPSPKDTAAWLLEHIMLTKGAPHLKLRTRDLHALQYMSLDVIAFYLLAVVAMVYTSYRLVLKVDRYVPNKLKWQ